MKIENRRMKMEEGGGYKDIAERRQKNEDRRMKTEDRSQNIED